MMATIIETKKHVIDKEQISRILDIEPDIDPQNDQKQTIYILNGAIYQVTTDMKKDQCLELVKLKSLARKRNLSGSGSEDSGESVEKPLFGKKDVIYIDRQDGDSLQKLAVTFNCSIAEIKFANKIYNEQELHALRTVKVPVVKDGALYDKYSRENKENESNKEMENNVKTDDVPFVADDDVDSKYKFRVQEPLNIDPHLNYLSDGEDDEDIYDIRDHKNGESVHLLADKTVFVNRVHAGYPVNVCESTLPELMTKIDETIKKNVEEAEGNNENLEEVVSTLDKQVVFPMDHGRAGHEKYGSVCALSWKHFVFIICLVAVIIPTIYFVHFYYKRHKS